MGNEAFGVFEESEVSTLSDSEKELLKNHVLHHVLTSSEIHKIISSNPRLLRQVTQQPEIKKKLKAKAGALHKHLKKKRK
jgi:hypothetical protein